jgi:hypothetical protein
MGVFVGATVPVALLLPRTGSFAGGLSSAWADAAPGPTNPQQRIRELEERVKILELQQETVDHKLRLDIDRNGRAFEEIDRRLRALEERPAAPAETAALEAQKSAELEAMCRDPYIKLPSGIRRLKPGCESAGSVCDAPEVVDGHGVRRVLAACVPTMEKERGVCDPPYYFDAKGLKRVKRECM